MPPGSEVVENLPAYGELDMDEEAAPAQCPALRVAWPIISASFSDGVSNIIYLNERMYA